MEHAFDAEGMCATCGFDGAEWWHWKHNTYEGRAKPNAIQPKCKPTDGPRPCLCNERTFCWCRKECEKT